MRKRLLAALAGALAIMAVGAGIALAVSQSLGTAGELNYQINETSIDAGDPTTVKARCQSTRHVTGGGYDTLSDTQINESRPYDSGDNGTAPDDGWAVEFNPPGIGQAAVAVYAICDN